MLKQILIILCFTTLLIAENISFMSKVNSKSKQEVFVTVNQKALKKDKIISIDLPDNLTATYKNNKFIYRKDGDFTWSGKATDGNKEDSILLTTKDGATYGVIVRNKIRYVIQKNDDGTYKVFKSKEDKVLKEKNDFIKLTQKNSLELTPSDINQSYMTPTVGNDEQITAEYTRSIASDEPLVRDYITSPLIVASRIDVMVLYTQEYADAYGSGLNAKIQFSIDYANVSMENSNISLAFNLAHQELYENILSNETVTIDTALYHIKDSDDVKQLRAIYSIDMTTLFRLHTTGGAVGIGFMPYDTSRVSFRESSYSVTEFSDEVFAHEAGHNFGCAHDWNTDNCSNGDGLFSYSCGYDTVDFGTIMSYNYIIIPYFSNPDILWNGTTIGVPEGGSNPADCSRTINETKDIMANNDDITETNEVGDYLSGNSTSGYTIVGNLDPEVDRDSYLLSLGNETTIMMSSEYTNIAYYANLYTENGYLIRSFITSSETITLENGNYIIVISNENDSTGEFYTSTRSYTVNLSTNYTSQNTLVPIINYLLN